MPNRFIPLTNTAPFFEQIVTLDGVDFLLKFAWNDRCQRWFCEIRSATGTILAAARKVCADIPFIVHDTTDGLPAGQLWFVSLDGSGTDPGLLDLGENIQLYYVTEDNVA